MSGAAWTGVAVAGVTATYALGSRRLASTPVSSAMVFVGCGVLLGPAVLGVIDLGHATGQILTLLEATLALVLFTDAMTVRRRDLRSGGFLPETAGAAAPPSEADQLAKLSEIRSRGDISDDEFRRAKEKILH